MEKRTSASITTLWAIGLLMLASLACAQAGEILPPAEATARAEATRNPVRPTATPGVAEEGNEEGSSVPEGPQVGDVVYLAGRGFLISLVAEPCAVRMIAGQERGAEVTIIDIAECEGAVWYKIDAPTGEGWVPMENITTEQP
jgi:hypothetical protein